MATKIVYAPGTSSPGIVKRATDQIGHSFRVGYCLYWCLVHVFRVPGLGDYDHDGDADCMDYWKAAVKRGTVVETTKGDDIPAGALAIWSGGSKGYGHAAVVIAKGEIASTDLPTRGKIGRVPITEPAKQWGVKLIGYVLVDGNGFTLLRDVPKPAPAPAADQYKVSSAAGVNVRDWCDVKTGKKIATLKKGTKITADAVLMIRNREWIVHQRSGKRVFSAREYFTKL